MQIDIMTLFPEMFEGPFQASIIKRALEAGLTSIDVHNIRDWAPGKHRQCDDTPYGGGGGMIMKPEPLFGAVEAVLGVEVDTASSVAPPCPIVLMTPQGRPLTQTVARELAGRERLVLVCGRYEGIDERVREHLITDQISIGDYVLSGGELAAMVVVDAVTRLLPGALGDPEATQQDSFSSDLLEYPHYTRPATFRGWEVPQTLLSGHHAKLTRWRRQTSLYRTWTLRPDLLERARLDDDDLAYLASLDVERDP
jgi:tRNA (guanine37-N1)-methyltransferase